MKIFFQNQYAVILSGCCLAVFFCSCGKKEKAHPKPATVEKEVVAPTPAPQTDIYQTIRNGDTTSFMTWLFEGKDLDLQNNSGETALIVASKWNRPTYVKDLLANGVDPNIQDGSGRAALHTAALSNNIKVIELLLNSGSVNPTLTDADGLTAKDLAAMRNHGKAAVLLSEGIDRYLTSFTPEIITDEPVEEITEAVLLSTDFRIWTSASGDKLDAAFIQSIFDHVVLQARDGTMLRIAINRLAHDDQILVRKLSGIDPLALAGARSKKTGTRARRNKSSSLAARIGNGSGWTILEDCRLLSNDSNDGDSFHVKHEGKEYIFRLYYVDAAETDNNFPKRIRDQASYFKISKEDTLKLGREASKFTKSVLAAAPFTVYTKWIDARGNSQLKRHFALVETQLGDLDELLTREGLVRQYGMQAGGGASSKKANELGKLEREARKDKAGGWRD